MIQNPILRGFNPDPSFLRVGDDYYIATSTFEWFPGVQIHHSKDLVHWRLLDHALKTREQLDLYGVADSGGIWAPSLTWDKGLFYLLYTPVRTCGMGRPYKDTPNFLITAQSLHGPWSAPIHLNSSGFDPALFHDENGRKWVVNMAWDFRKGQPRFDGILLQEYDPTAQKMIGPITTILRKEELIEGPNLYQRNGWYYLMLAEGGTGWNHGISLARSRHITGPYELDPQGSLLTTRDDESILLQKAGHGELVQVPNGDWYLAHLCSRPVSPQRRCILGRETALQKVTWTDDGWLRLAHGGHHPQVQVEAPAHLPATPWPTEPTRDNFASATWSKSWASLRQPITEAWASLTAHPGWLRLYGRESLFSLFEQSLVAKRVESLTSTVETCLEFSPPTFNQMAGLIFYYDTRTHYYLRVTHEEKLGKVLGIILTDDTVYDELSESQIVINDWSKIYLRGVLNHAAFQFFASPDGTTWQPIGPILDATKISDDYGKALHFTGAFFGLCCQDLGGTKMFADFDYFELKPTLS